MVLKSSFPKVTLPEKPLGLYLLEHIDKYRDAVALVDPTNDLQITFGQVKQQSMDFARKLLSLGLEKDDVVGLIAPFKPQFIPLIIGVALTRATMTFYDVQTKPDDIMSHLSHDGLSICIVDEMSASITADELKKISKCAKGTFAFAEILSREMRIDDPEVDLASTDVDLLNDPVHRYSTSGAAASPKIMTVTHRAVVAIVESCRGGFAAAPGDVIATVCPALHAFPIAMAFNFLVQGAKHLAMSFITPNDFNDGCIERYSVNGVIMADAYALAKIIDEVPACGESLKFILNTGQKFPPPLIERARKKFGIVVSSFWGTTETSGVCVGASNATPADSAGKLLPNVSLKVLDITSGDELGPNTNGELCVKSPLMLEEYSNSPNEKTEAKDADGWFHTGDFGYYDDQGFIYILDRIKDVIKSNNSISIYPSELEAVLMSHPGVADAAVIRVEHPVYVEAPKAFIVKKDPKLTKDEILSYFNERMAKEKMLHGGLEFLDVIPKAGVNKPLKRNLV